PSVVFPALARVSLLADAGRARAGTARARGDTARAIGVLLHDASGLEVAERVVARARVQRTLQRYARDADVRAAVFGAVAGLSVGALCVVAAGEAAALAGATHVVGCGGVPVVAGGLVRERRAGLTRECDAAARSRARIRGRRAVAVDLALVLHRRR